MEPRHTPGPWELIIRSADDGIWGCIGAKVNRDTFCRVDCCNPEKTANARLISCAPEMLELLQEIEQWFAVNNIPLSPGCLALSDEDIPVTALLRRVIAKAKGGAE